MVSFRVGDISSRSNQKGLNYSERDILIILFFKRYIEGFSYRHDIQHLVDITTEVKVLAQNMRKI